VIHLSGARDERLVADNYRRERIPAFVAAFHHHMEEVYSAADFAVARAGRPPVWPRSLPSSCPAF